MDLFNCNKKLREYKHDVVLEAKIEYKPVFEKHKEFLPDADKLFWDVENRPKVLISDLIQIIDSLCEIIENERENTRL